MARWTIRLVGVASAIVRSTKAVPNPFAPAPCAIGDASGCGRPRDPPTLGHCTKFDWENGSPPTAGPPKSRSLVPSIVTCQAITAPP